MKKEAWQDESDVKDFDKIQSKNNLVRDSSVNQLIEMKYKMFNSDEMNKFEQSALEEDQSTGELAVTRDLLIKKRLQDIETQKPSKIGSVDSSIRDLKAS